VYRYRLYDAKSGTFSKFYDGVQVAEGGKYFRVWEANEKGGRAEQYLITGQQTDQWEVFSKLSKAPYRAIRAATERYSPGAIVTPSSYGAAWEKEGFFSREMKIIQTRPRHSRPVILGFTKPDEFNLHDGENGHLVRHEEGSKVLSMGTLYELFENAIIKIGHQTGTLAAPPR
jgi:hypothetical protein